VRRTLSLWPTASWSSLSVDSAWTWFINKINPLAPIWALTERAGTGLD